MEEEIMQMVMINNIQEAEDLNIPRNMFHALNPFDQLTDRHFIRELRLTKHLASELITLLEPYLTVPTRLSSINAQTKVLIALQFFASGCYQTRVGHNLFVGVSQSTVSRSIDEVVDVLNRPEIFNRFVKFPGNISELQKIREAFYESYHIPGIIGAIDCTHVAIVPPPRDDVRYPEHIYVNRKNYHSINVQLICDSNLKIMNVNARYPGSTHDVYIWNNSQVENVVTQLYRKEPGYFLIGDSGYPLRPWLQTPFQNPQPDSPEFFYNNDFKKARSSIERCNGVLKMRFRCLLKDRTLHYYPPKCAKIINACVILHNMCIKNNIPHPHPEDGDENVDFGIYDYRVADNEAHGENADLLAGRRLRTRIVNNFYRNRHL